MLLFGKDRFRDFPDAYLQAGAFGGNDKTKIIDTREFRDPLPGLIEPTHREYPEAPANSPAPAIRADW